MIQSYQPDRTERSDSRDGYTLGAVFGSCRLQSWQATKRTDYCTVVNPVCVHTRMYAHVAQSVRLNKYVHNCTTWFKVQSKNIKSESGAERLGLVSMHAGEVSGAVINLSGTLSSL